LRFHFLFLKIKITMKTFCFPTHVPSRIRFVALFTALLTVWLLGAGCKTTPPGAVAEPTAKIAEQQDRAKAAASAFKKNHRETDATYIEVRSKYNAAASKNKGYLAAIQTGLINGEKNFDTPTYKGIATRAGEATQAFVDLAEKNTPAEARPMGLAAIGAAAIADALINAGVAIWKTNSELDAARRKEVADSLKQFEWPSWGSL
jgi:hypothetical protein